MSEFSRKRIDELNAKRLAGVDPKLRIIANRIIELVRGDGFDLLVTCGFRSIAEQNKLFAQGRSKAGKIVTNARGGQSKHNFGKAVDFAVLKNGNVTWDVNIYKKTIGKYAATQNVEWGGNWKSFKDYPHIQI